MNNETKVKITETLTKIKEEGKKLASKVDMPIATLIGFVVLFILDLILIALLTDTSFVVACLLLVVEVAMAVCLAHSNYGVLGLVAIAELLVGILTKNIGVALLALFMYFITLVAIHLLKVYGGKTNQCKNA